MEHHELVISALRLVEFCHDFMTKQAFENSVAQRRNEILALRAERQAQIEKLVIRDMVLTGAIILAAVAAILRVAMR